MPSIPTAIPGVVPRTIPRAIPSISIWTIPIIARRIISTPIVWIVESAICGAHYQIHGRSVLVIEFYELGIIAAIYNIGIMKLYDTVSVSKVTTAQRVGNHIVGCILFGIICIHIVVSIPAVIFINVSAVYHLRIAICGCHCVGST